MLHEEAAGLTAAEIEQLVAELRGRFPDRVFESERAARELADLSTARDAELVALRGERDRLRRRAEHLEQLLTRLVDAAAAAGGARQQGTPGLSRPTSSHIEETVTAAAELLFGFAATQEQTAQSVEEILGRSGAGGGAADIVALLRRFATSEAAGPEELALFRQRLRSLQVLPGALMTGAQQSWKGGTREILEMLDPRDADRGILKYPALLKDLERKFEQFWSEFDRNIEHYYRGRFERVYRDKMEEGL